MAGLIWWTRTKKNQEASTRQPVQLALMIREVQPCTLSASLLGACCLGLASQLRVSRGTGHSLGAGKAADIAGL
jgi:hypothetical protein